MNIAIYLLLVTQAPVAPVADEVTMSLREAIDRAAESNPTLLAERASARAADRRTLDGTRAFLPTLTFGAQGLRTTDPVAVFGLKLRQEQFFAEDLSLDALNRPASFVGYNASATVELPVLAPEGLFGYAAARKASRAVSAAVDRAAGATRLAVIRAYWDAQLSTLRLDALGEALGAARAHAEQAEALREQGLVTGLDARLARVHAASIAVRRLAAAAEAGNQLSSLGALLALPDEARLTLTDPLDMTGEADPSSDTPRDMSRRGDLVALRLGVEAAEAMVKSAWGSNLPSVGLFGSLGRHARSSPWGEGSGHWTVGIGVTWTPFRGLAGVGAVGGAQADRMAAELRLEAAEREARVEVLRAQRFLSASRERVTVAAEGESEARAALDQAGLRYRTGTSTITELLDVQTAATSATLSLLAVRRDLLLAQAALDFAYGVYDR